MNPLPRTLAATMKLVGMRNKDLAVAMTDRGFKMSEATVSKILHGNRSCSFEEVLAFADITGAPLEWLSQGPEWLDPDPDTPRRVADSQMRGYHNRAAA